MKTILLRTAILALFVAALLLPHTAQASKMDPMLRLMASEPTAAKAWLGKSVGGLADEELVDIILKSTDPALTSAEIDMRGGSVRSILGDIMTAFVPLSELEAIAALDEVEAMEASTPMRLLMDKARDSLNSNVETVQTSYDGTNVIVGAIDSGLDYSRDDFKNGDGTTRVQYLRFLTASSSTAFTATECAKDYIDAGSCSIAATNDSTVGHGTHVTGIGAGNGGGTSYIGVAPMADIMFVRNDFYDDLSESGASFSAGVLDGVSEIFQKADIINKPAVVNISQGTHIGAHDNTSLLEQGINNAVAGQYSSTGVAYGRAVVIAAGNEHTVPALYPGDTGVVGGIHDSFSVASGSSKGYRVYLRSDPSTDISRMVVDAWFDSASMATNCTITAKAYYIATAIAGGMTTDDARVNIGNLAFTSDQSATDDDGVVQISAATDAADSQNGKPRAMFLYAPVGSTWAGIYYDTTATGDGYFLDVIVRASGGTTCTGDMWIEGGAPHLINFMKGIDTGAFDVGNGTTNGNGYSFGDGDDAKVVSIPGTASGAITAGSYLSIADRGTCTSNSCWVDSNGTTHDATDPTTDTTGTVFGTTAGVLSPFSSSGPPNYSYSGYKPDVTAPGDAIVSVLPQGYTPATGTTVDSTHYKNQGTSMASPLVAGIVALMMEKDHGLTAAEAKQALTSTASQAGSPDNDSGYGKVDASAAIATVSADTSVLDGTGNLSQSDLDGGGGGGGSSSSSCGSTLLPVAPATAAANLLFILVPVVAIAVRRKRRH